MSADTVTVLHAPGRRLVKIIGGTPDAPDIVNYDETAVFFDVYEEPVTGLDGLAALLHRLEPVTDALVVRGALADPNRWQRVRRLVHDRINYPAPLVEVPRRWVALDFDKLMRPADVAVTDLAGCAAAAIATLPVEFHGAAFVVMATSGHGIKPTMRLRIWFWLDRPTSGTELKAWLPMADDSVYRTVQAIYTARPVFTGAMVDPVPHRLLTQPGRAVVVVPPSDVLLPPAPPRAVVERSAVPASGGWYSKKVAWRIDDACDRVSEAEAGTVHNTLYAAAFWLGGHLHYGTHDAADIADQLMEALPDTAKDRKQARRAAEDGLAAGQSRPVFIEGPKKPAVDISRFLAKSRKVVV